MVQRAKLKKSPASVPLLGIGGTYAGRTKGIVSIQLNSIHDPTSHCSIDAYILPRLTTKLPSEEAAFHSWPHLTGLQLADPDYGKPGLINIIIGSDNYGSVILPGLIQDQHSALTAQQTVFGWVLSGAVNASDTTSVSQAHHCTPDYELKELIKKFWELEELSATKTSKLTEDEEECERHFQSTHTRDSSGRYTVRLPLKGEPTLLGDSRIGALHSLNRLFKRFSSNPAFQRSYTDFIVEYQRLGHMEEEDSPNRQITPEYYLPHHGVLREDSRTTKLRVVFNGSYRTTSGHSLNDILHVGAKLQNDITDVLLWIRTYRIIFSTDIVKMFRQIAIHEEDWKLQKILWYKEDNRLVSYRLTTVTYGLNCAPFLALRTLQQLIQDEGHRFPKAIAPMERGRYVDDIFGGADSSDEAKQVIQHLIGLCEAGGFPLQKWSSSHPEILPKSGDDSQRTVEFEPAQFKLLGLQWKSISDSFHFSAVTTSKATSLTKRVVSSEVARLYDPLGLIAPILVRAKFILQELWLLKNGWDDPLPAELQKRWREFRLQLQELEQISIPRWLGNVSSPPLIEIHGFSDASQLAMAAAIYTRISNEEGKVITRLVCSKTKVAPIKRISIPRLELTAALLLVRLIKKTTQALELAKPSITCWTDSSVTLIWITTHPARWKDFVCNRVSVINELLPEATWRFVPGKENPADCASRGLTPAQLAQHELWWKGPTWLPEPRSSWPATGTRSSQLVDMEERTRIIMTTVARQTPHWELLDRYSSITRLFRITAICKRILSCMRKLPNSSPLKYPLTPLEIQQSQHLWVRIIQQAAFSYEIGILSRNEHLPKSNPLVRLTPYLDKDRLLRVGGRLHNAQIDTDSKHPLILPRRSPLSTLIIDDAHKRMLHGGTQVTLNFIRSTYWIIGGRAPVRSHILRCGRCTRYRGVRAQQLMGQLPPSRVVPARPFFNSGLDYAGPIMLKTWRGRAARTYKGYLAVFVCLATSAIHLEVVTDYTTDAFIAAYKRFTGRRGICATLQSDCGTNFVGADAELRRQFETSSKELHELASVLASDNTKWIFNPPSAPHFGGKWEAAVKSTKFHLRRILKDTTLTYEELTTVTVQIEAVLNSRPLCPLSDDATDYTALTPGHFLIGEPLTALPEPSLTTEKNSRLSRWQLLRQKVDHFWSRWSTECLQRYQAISKWHHPSNEIKKGSLVLITDERYPPGKWPLARVIELHPASDGLTRVVTVRTATSTFKRPIAKLCVLPTDSDLTNSTEPSSKLYADKKMYRQNGLPPVKNYHLEFSLRKFLTGD
ncbi:PREDICTED: uncharacterized protein LOC105556699 [Vollenhovia emeryi]|uniref:uncharacterized protein LOC105556699 n=1 Tax=Vollenhovia emeryi TaxID=411798 RepID=UPI0005F4D577|nr:PREDICTED: uncharacterized protein LOC105556699 [Vollenhovia emeryi]